MTAPNETTPNLAPGNPVEIDTFGVVLSRLLAEETGYLRLGELTESAADHEEPESFCHRLVEAALLTLGNTSAKRARFFAWALAEAPRSRLVPVLASQNHLDRGDRPAARRAAEWALSLNQNDLYAQRLYRRALGQPEPDLAGRFCANPFDKLETHPKGKVYFCCPAWLPIPIGNLGTESADEIWNSETARDIRRSILDGSYRYCSRMHCPKITAGSLPKTVAVTNGEHRHMIASGQTRLARGPKRMVLNHDRSCNLSCPSCRTRLIVARKAEQAAMDGMADRVLGPLIANARKVHITAGGDAFGSAHYRHVLRSLSRARPPDLKVDLQTNGLLMASSWDELELDGLVDALYVSIDAAQASTYKVVRRGGDFERLLDNLDFAARKRRDGRINYVRLDFVVQTLNFREMPAAVDLVERFGFDGLKFQMIRSWNTYGPDEFAWHNIGSPEHPQFAELLEVMKDPRLRAGFVEFWGFHSVRTSALPAAS